MGGRLWRGGRFAAVAKAVAGERAAMIGGSWATGLELRYGAGTGSVLR